MMSSMDPGSPREPQESPRNGVEPSSRGRRRDRIEIFTTIVGLGIAINEARKGQADANNLLILFASLCVLGVNTARVLLGQAIDRMFGGGSGNGSRK